jgi:hypothetical protein
MGTPAPDTVKRLFDRFDPNRDATDGSQLTAYSPRLSDSGPLAVGRKPIADVACRLAASESAGMKGAAVTNEKRKPVVVRADRLVLEDERGRPRAVLMMDKDGPVLAMLDVWCRVRAMLRVREDGPGLVSLHNKTGKRVWTAPE